MLRNLHFKQVPKFIKCIRITDIVHRVKELLKK